METMGNLWKIYLSKGIAKLADVMESKDDQEYADALRGWNYRRQVKSLQRNIGKRVRVMSSGFGNPSMSITDCIRIDYGTINFDGTFIRNEGPMSKVVPGLHIFVDVFDDTGRMVGSNGIPFMGAGIIREVRLEDGELLYINPEVDERYYGRLNKLTADEKIRQQRRLYGDTKFSWQKQDL